MGVAAARLVFLAFLGLTGSIIYNALYLQEEHRAVSGAMGQPGAPLKGSPVTVAKLPPVSTDLPPVAPQKGGPTLIVRAVQRELAARGFAVGPVDGKQSAKTKAAISAYEKAHDLPVTGTATDELLRHILLGDSVPSGGATGSVTEKTGKAAFASAANVRAIQQILADLGYSPGPIDGAMGDATSRAISAFQHDRKLPETGTITPKLLGELDRVTSRDTGKLLAER
jgi:peptidoglycan hydrolase-like protein with peptidoglycan-binding domain